MPDSTKLFLAAAAIGGVFGAASAVLYLRWRAAHRTATDRASTVLRQLADVADRMEQLLAHPAPAGP